MKGPVMKQSDAAWFSGPATPFSAGRPSLTERVPCRADTQALIQHLVFHGPLSAHMLSTRCPPSPVGSEFHPLVFFLPLFYPGFTAAAKLSRPGFGGIPHRGHRLQRSPPSSSAPSPNLFTLLPSTPAFSPPALPLASLQHVEAIRREMGSGMYVLNPNQRFEAERFFTFVSKRCESFTSNLKGPL